MEQNRRRDSRRHRSPRPPLRVYLARVFSAGHIPGGAVEAARMDGAGELRIFWPLGRRMVMPGPAALSLFQLTAMWNKFFLPLVGLSDQYFFPLSRGLYA